MTPPQKIVGLKLRYVVAIFAKSFLGKNLLGLILGGFSCWFVAILTIFFCKTISANKFLVGLTLGGG